MKGLIMAGGEGTRLRPITCGKPKPMIDVMGKPVMEHIINLMKNAGITDIAVTLMYMPQAIMEYFGDGGRFGVNLHYYIEETPLGTAGSVKNAEEFLDEDFLIISGDCLTDIDVAKAIGFHKENKAMATLVLSKVDNPLEYGIVVTDESGKIVRFLEKPNWSEVFSDTANTGIYVLSPQVLTLMKSGEKYDFSNDIFPLILSHQKPLYGFVSDGYWCDIGDVFAYRKCHFDILDKKINLKIEAKEIKEGIYAYEDSVIEKGAELSRPCYIGRGVTVQSGAKLMPYSIVGDNCKISGGVSIKQSILHKNVQLCKMAEIRGSIIADGVYMGSRSLVLENTVIGEKTHIGEMCEIKNNIKIWPNKNISNETVVSENLVWGDNFSRKLFGENGVSGEINVDITPEFATRLGAAFGAAHRGKKITVSSGGASSLEMLKNAFMAGLLSTGAQVYNLGTLTLPIARRGVMFNHVDGGIHIDISHRNDDEYLVINFLNAQGGDIGRNDERKLETLFMREDFVRCEPSNIKEVVNLEDYKMYYIRELLNEFMNTKFDISVSLSGNIETVGAMLHELGIKVVSSSRNAISAQIDEFGENIMITDEKSRIVVGDMYFALVCLILLKSGQKSIVAPFTTTNTIELLAEKFDAKVYRCKTSKSEIMATMLGSNAITQFRMMYDACYALIKICSFLSENKLKLHHLIDELPSIHIIEREVRCSASQKGMLIKAIANNAQGSAYGNRVELSEGVKIINDNGWVLVIPHHEKPVCRIITEGDTEEFASELCDFYINEAKKYLSD